MRAQRNCRPILAASALLAALLGPFGQGAVADPAAHPPQQKDYLTEVEADKIRDAQTPDLRIKLFLSFADDRLKKLQYELARVVQENRHDEIVNGLLNDYVGCVDDAADQIDEAQDKHADIRDGLKLMKEKDTEFLATLEKIDQSNMKLDAYRDNLEDAIEGTKEALNDVAEAANTPASAAAPVRRKQQ